MGVSTFGWVSSWLAVVGSTQLTQYSYIYFRLDIGKNCDGLTEILLRCLIVCEFFEMFGMHLKFSLAC